MIGELCEKWKAFALKEAGPNATVETLTNEQIDEFITNVIFDFISRTNIMKYVGDDPEICEMEIENIDEEKYKGLKRLVIVWEKHYYDIEATHGVIDPEQLPCVQRWRANQKKCT